MSTSHWHTRVKHWNNITPPLRPHTDSIAKQIEIVGKDSERVLVLGMTPELTQGFTNVTAVDREQVMIDHFWPGNTANKNARLGNWMSLHFNEGPFTGIVGDGSLNMLYWPTDIKYLLDRLLDSYMKPDAVLAVRVFTRPDTPVSLDDVTAAIPTLPWHAWRCLLNMHIAGSEGTVIPSKRMLEKFNELFPDRDALCMQTGWSLEEISNSMDSYKNSTTTTSYPTRQELLSAIPSSARDVHFIDVGTYPLANCYPILVFRK